MKASFFGLVTGAALVSAFGSGVFIPAQAVQLWSLDFAPEATGATGTGAGSITYDDGINTLRLQATFSGLSGNVTMAHLHGITAQPGTGTASVIVPSGSSLPGFPTGNTFGTYDQIFDLGDASTYRTAFITANGGTPNGARDALLASFDAGTTYFNIHTNTFPGGEIRAFTASAVVPEPMTLAGVGAAVGIMGGFKRRIRQTTLKKD